jgi:hypothetical protein
MSLPKRFVFEAALAEIHFERSDAHPAFFSRTLQAVPTKAFRFW